MLAYSIFFITVAAILAIATLGLNLQWGVAGQFNAGVAGFVAIGGYTLAIVTMPASERLLIGWQLPFAVALILSLAITGLAALLVGLATLRLRSDYLAIATFGIGSSIQVLANNLEPLTGGSSGLVGIPRPFESLGAQGFAGAYLVMVLLILIACLAAMQAALRSPWGRVQRAMREDETVCASLGKDIIALRLTSFVLGSMLMGLSGALYTGFVGATSPSEFMAILTFQIWAMLIVGGSGSNVGAIVGSFVIWGLWTLSGALIGLGLPPQWQAQGGALQSMLVGLVLVLTLLLRPQGLLGGARRA
jgi:branched-chain amino acid transport system permease protein